MRFFGDHLCGCNIIAVANDCHLPFGWPDHLLFAETRQDNFVILAKILNISICFDKGIKKSLLSDLLF
jgi:hypothetical protein